jgi:hypothetical protein
MALVHHELCFGCGRTNLFGLLLEVEEGSAGAVSGRCFIKQDHQGPVPGTAHDGLIATALLDAIALARGSSAQPASLTVEFLARAPVGAFLDIEATHTSATARAEGTVVAHASAAYDR